MMETVGRRRVRPSSEPWPVLRSTGVREEDRLAAEEPLEIRLNGRSLVVTMRTPGNDEELALGFLVNEGILAGPAPVAMLVNPLDPAQGNIANVRADALLRNPAARSFHASSACGVCGQASLDDMQRTFPPVAPGPSVARSLLVSLPAAMRREQALFDRTGGLHAAALFDAASGKLLCLREDVGRHNALDKVTGWATRAGRLPLRDAALLVSGRAGYEIVQKSVASGIPIVAAVGAPSSLAARLAEQANVTLVGFLREGSFNVYARPERIA
jgi:FdhD protein